MTLRSSLHGSLLCNILPCTRRQETLTKQCYKAWCDNIWNALIKKTGKNLTMLPQKSDLNTDHFKSSEPMVFKHSLLCKCQIDLESRTFQRNVNAKVLIWTHRKRSIPLVFGYLINDNGFCTNLKTKQKPHWAFQYEKKNMLTNSKYK